MTESQPQNPDQSQTGRGRSGNFWLRLAIAALFVGGVVCLSFTFGSQRILDFLASQEARAEAFRIAHPVAVFAFAFLIYVAVTGLSLPGATALTIVYGWFFDFLPALFLISFASTTGATIAFLMSRYFLRETIQQRFGSRLVSFNESLQREGAAYLFTLRLIFVVPFFVINLVMGLTPIRAWTFWWVSQLGMLPGTAVYTYAGNSFPEIETIQSVVNEHGLWGLLTHSGSDINLANLSVALILLGLFPIVMTFMVKRFKKPPSRINESDHSDTSSRP